MNLGETIKLLRKRNGLNQSQLAELCEITVTYLSLIENGKKEPTLSLLKTIANNLQVPLPILLFTALTEDDIPEPRKELFSVIKPSIDSMLQNLIDSNADSKG
jgi:transcriptional regulator with XRE-family HTH domain